MPTLDWMRTEFHYGYDSGDVLPVIADERRRLEEERIGGSYHDVYQAALTAGISPGSRVLELGPGRGSWTRALLSHLTTGTLHTVDFQDITRWLNPADYGGRLIPHQVTDNNYDVLPDGHFDFLFAWGVLCHWAQDDIETILRRLRGKLRPGGRAFCGYAAWDKLDRFGWDKGGVPTAFRDQPDAAIWWPRNTVGDMARLCERAGWRVLEADLDIVARDGICLLEVPVDANQETLP